MRLSKLLVVALAVSVTAAPVFAAGYSMAIAAQAAGELMPKDGAKRSLLFNLPEAKAKPSQLLSALRQARDQKMCLAICSPKLDYVRDLLKSTFKVTKTENFEGLYLIIVAERVDAAAIDEILKGRGIIAKYGVFK
jgi:nitrogen-specific signal transduction histidine kinase